MLGLKTKTSASKLFRETKGNSHALRMVSVVSDMIDCFEQAHHEAMLICRIVTEVT